MNEAFSKCECQKCGGGIEFESSQLGKGEARLIECPHCGKETSVFLRPFYFDGFIGQEEAKEKLRLAYERAKSKEEFFPNVLLFGKNGLGKSELGNLIAKEISEFYGLKVTCFSADKINSDVRVWVNFINNLDDNDVVFIDDIDGLKQEFLIYLRSAVVDHQTTSLIGSEIMVVNVPKFTLIATAENPSKLPFFFSAAFPVMMELSIYTPEEISKLAYLFAEQAGLTVEGGTFENFSEFVSLPNEVGNFIELIRIYTKSRNIKDVITLETIQEALKTLHSPQEPVQQMRLPISSDVKREVWRRDEGKCTKCGSQERLEYDHVIPVVKGGSNTSRNIQLLCEPCNRSKSAAIQ